MRNDKREEEKNEKKVYSKGRHERKKTAEEIGERGVGEKWEGDRSKKRQFRAFRNII